MQLPPFEKERSLRTLQSNPNVNERFGSCTDERTATIPVCRDVSNNLDP